MSADLHGIHHFDRTLILSDGVRLISRLWHPEEGGPWPALLMRQPYGRSIASTITYAHPRWWAQQGFLVVVQDVRGQGQSEGDFQGFQQEANDTAETHAWLRNLPECNGRLGCFGFSYQGLTQLTAPATTPPPDCMAPAMTGLDERRHWSCEGGAHWWHLGLGWGLQLAALQAARRGDSDAWLEIRRSLEDSGYLRDGPELLRRHDPNGMAATWFANDPANRSIWTKHTPPEAWLSVPMLLIGGWWDPHLIGMLDLWHRSQAAGGTPELEIGPATHLQWWPQLQTRMLAFFQHHLQDRHTERPAPQPRFWNITRGLWQPADGGSSPTWGLFSNGLACSDPMHGQLVPEEQSLGMETIVHDPWRAAPAIGGHLGTSPGAADRSVLDQRTDIATFSSAPLPTEVLLSGQPELRLTVNADQPGFDLCVSLSRVPRGSDAVEQLSTGFLRTIGEQALQPSQRRILLQPLQASLESGDRLRVSIAGAAWPAIGVNPGCSDVPCGAPGPHHRVVTLTLQLADSTLQLIPFNSGRLQLD